MTGNEEGIDLQGFKPEVGGEKELGEIWRGYQEKCLIGPYLIKLHMLYTHCAKH